MSEKKVKISISVDEEVANWIDKEIEQRVYRNRSHAFDVAGHLLMTSKKSAIIE